MTGARRVGAAVAALTVAAGGYVALDVADLAPGVLTRDTRAAAPPRPAADSTHAPLDRPSAAPPLADLARAARRPTTAGLAAALSTPLKDPALGPSVGIEVRDGATGEVLFGRDAGRPRTPASTMKLLTAAGVTHGVAPAHRFETRVVAGRTARDVVLVAGGDTLLAGGRGDTTAVAGRAGLADLAGQVAAALRTTGGGPVRVHLDDTYAKGPALAPGWAPADVAAGIVGPVAMLGLDDARAVPGRAAPTDPALHAAQVFAARLVEAGVPVTGTVARSTAPAGARRLGVVRSATRSEVLSLALEESDNSLTETVARSAAVEAGVAPTFPAVVAWIRAQLAAQGVDVRNVTLVDASGLSRTTRVPAAVVADVLTTASTGRSPALADVVARLPVAGLTGTLQDRFHGPGAAPGQGLARAKTGTLTGVHALGGTVVDADGRLLVYAILVERTGGTPAARAALDRVVATLAGCGCR